MRTPSGGKGADALYRSGQQGLTFWLNRIGREQFDVEGEVGFSDMAHILLRRRENSGPIRPLRTRFTATFGN